MLYLSAVIIAIRKGIDVHRKWNRFPFPFLSVTRDASVEADTIEPRAYIAFSSEVLQTLPKVYQHLLKEVVHLVFILREHITYGINSTFMFSHDSREVLFIFVGCPSFETSAKVFLHLKATIDNQ